MPERPAGLGLVLGATLVTLALGYALKAPCAPGDWSDGRQYTRLCYSDVVALYGSGDRDRGLTEDRVPYLDGANEYPVLTGVAMYAAAVPARSYLSFFNWTVALLTVAALATSWALHRMVGWWALLFALAPTLAVYGFMNWDLVAVALATLGTLAYVRRRDATSGALLGLGAAAKLYPGLLAVPFAGGRLLERRGRRGGVLLGSAVLGWAAVNLPFAVGGFGRWSLFFRFNAARPADWDSLWFLVHNGPMEPRLGAVIQPGAWVSNVQVNALSAIGFVTLSGALWLVARHRNRALPAWSLGFPLLIAFLLTSKVYSPQYGLWLLPWFALTLPSLPHFVAFEVADVLVFVTRFSFFARLEGLGGGLPFGAFQVAILLRAAVLVWCLVTWVRRWSAEDREPALAVAMA